MRLSGLEITNRSQIFVTFQEIQNLAENHFPFFKKNRMSRSNFLLWKFWRQKKKFLTFLHHSISSHFLQFGVDAKDRSRWIWQKKKLCTASPDFYNFSKLFWHSQPMHFERNYWLDLKGFSLFSGNFLIFRSLSSYTLRPNSLRSRMWFLTYDFRRIFFSLFESFIEGFIMLLQKRFSPHCVPCIKSARCDQIVTSGA